MLTLRLVRSRCFRGAASALAAAAALSLLGACGPKKEAAPAPSPAPTPLTKEEYVSQANVVCTAWASKSPAASATAADLLAAIRKEVESRRELQTKLEALVAPPGDREQLRTKFLDLRKQQVDALEATLPEVEKAAATGDKAATERAFLPGVNRAVELSKQAAPFAATYGLASACVD